MPTELVISKMITAFVPQNLEAIFASIIMNDWTKLSSISLARITLLCHVAGSNCA